LRGHVWAIADWTEAAIHSSALCAGIRIETSGFMKTCIQEAVDPHAIKRCDKRLTHRVAAFVALAGDPCSTVSFVSSRPGI